MPIILPKSDKKVHSFRLSDALMNDLKAYAENEEISTTVIISKLIKDFLKGKTVYRGRTNTLVEAFKSVDKDVVFNLNEGYTDPDDITDSFQNINGYLVGESLGFVEYNNCLDIWDNGTYHAIDKNYDENDDSVLNTHKGLSILKKGKETYYVIISGDEENNIAWTVSKEEALREAVASKNKELIRIIEEDKELKKEEVKIEIKQDDDYKEKYYELKEIQEKMVEKLTRIETIINGIDPVKIDELLNQKER